MMIDRHIDCIITSINKRLIDEIRWSPNYINAEWFRKSTTILDINNIATYMADHQDKWSLEKDFPNIAMPWQFIWGEYILGKYNINVDNKIKTVGIYGATTNQSMKCYQIFFVFLEDRNEKIYFLAEIIIELDKCGKYNNGQVYGIKTFYDIPKDSRNEIYSRISMLASVLFMSISFCHCKNIIINKEPAQIKINKSRIKKGKLPFFRFNKILIDPMKEILKQEGQSEKLGLKKALHICRGHFATYTHEAPLFGRVTGTFWKPMHLRGNKKEGVVVKEYQIKAPS
jgi:hypothetical protein